MKEYYFNKNISWNMGVHFDATCSGIQHISCLLEDIDLGKNVNINVSDDNHKPNDIYTYLINPIILDIQEFVKSNLNYESFLHLNIDRSFVKKIIMTIPYSVTIYGIKEQIKLSSTDKEKEYYIDENDNKKKYRYLYKFKGTNDKVIKLSNSDLMILSKIIKSTVLKKYKRLDALFKYYGDMCSLLVKLNIPISWQTSNGIITQVYLTQEEEVFSYSFNKKRHKFVLKNKALPNIIDLVKTKQGIVPNVVHYLDAYH
jgi:DNA-directed RNA polymerase